jgi:hypothetical protein
MEFPIVFLTLHFFCSSSTPKLPLQRPISPWQSISSFLPVPCLGFYLDATWTSFSKVINPPNLYPPC